jgi:hypothetical protein
VKTPGSRSSALLVVETRRVQSPDFFPAMEDSRRQPVPIYRTIHHLPHGRGTAFMPYIKREEGVDFIENACWN